MKDRRMEMRFLFKCILALSLFLVWPQGSFSAEKKIITEKPLIVDVCSSWEYKQKHYPDAVNIPLDEIEARINEFGNNKNKPIVLYCASGVRAEEAKEVLKEKGFKNVRNAGSLEELMKNSGSELKY